MNHFPNYLCKILLRDASCPFYTKLQRPARIGYICTLYQHPLDQDAILRRRQNAFDRLLITVSLLIKQTKKVHGFKDNSAQLMSWVELNSDKHEQKRHQRLMKVSFLCIRPCFIQLFGLAKIHTVQGREFCSHRICSLCIDYVFTSLTIVFT